MPLVRSAITPDIPALYELWYDRMVLEQQMQPSLQLAADAYEQWRTAAEMWIHDSKTLFMVVVESEQPIGYIVAQRVVNRPGIMPLEIGVIRELIVDLHTKYGQGGIGKMLFDVVAARLTEQGIEKILAYVSRQSAVEQAFWRGLGAAHTQDIFEWYK